MIDWDRERGGENRDSRRWQRMRMEVEIPTVFEMTKVCESIRDIELVEPDYINGFHSRFL
jgi:hypothetical protein